jgi:hypothetical protein
VCALAEGIYLGSAFLRLDSRLLRHVVSGEGVLLPKLDAWLLDRLTNLLKRWYMCQTWLQRSDPDDETETAHHHVRHLVMRVCKALAGDERQNGSKRRAGYVLMPRPWISGATKLRLSRA